ncbi:MAG: hypothetical protein FWF10_06065 [Clostridiales bacterium]|nr:hypothetical protein [Clostridiales bacterium]
MKRKLIALLLAALLLLPCGTLALSALAEEYSESTGRIALRETDDPAPKGERNKSIVVTLPMIALGDAPLYELTVTPVVSTDLNAFPFVVDRLNYTESYPGGALQPGQTWNLSYTFMVDNYATRGVKQVDFELRYRVGSATGEWEQGILRVFVNITKGYSPGGGGGGGGLTVMPKLIIESYHVDKDRLYAGESFTLTMRLRNTSETESIKNLEIQTSEVTGLLLPAGNGAGTMFIREILPDETVTQTLTLQSAPDAEAKPYTLLLRFGYDGGTSKQAYTSETSITLPILQRVRVECDPPISYNIPYLGEDYGLYLNIYNKGKSTVYNCEIRVEGEGVSMVELYFGGNLSAGGMLSADFGLMIEMAGFLTPEIIVSFEDIYGEVMEVRFPLELDVYDPGGEFGDIAKGDGGIGFYPGGPDDFKDPSVNGETGGSWWIWVVAAVGAALLVAAIVLIATRSKRKRALEL